MADEPYEDEQTEGMVPRAHIRDLEAKAKERDDLAAQVATYQRNEAFRTAGLDPADKRASYFVKGYDGDLTPDAIRDAATEAGFLNPPVAQPPAAPNVPGAMERIFAASTGAQPPSAPDFHGDLAEADRITDPAAREAAILGVVERHGGTTSRTAQ